jgi:hypothetical protein
LRRRAPTAKTYAAVMAASQSPATPGGDLGALGRVLRRVAA